INDLDNVFLYDIDDLQEVVNSNLRERAKEADHAEKMVAEEVERMMARLKVAEVTPTIVGLQEQLEQIRLGELEKVKRRMGPLSPSIHSRICPPNYRPAWCWPRFPSAKITATPCSAPISPTCPPARRSEPAPSAAPRSCANCGPISSSNPSAAISTLAFANSMK